VLYGFFLFRSGLNVQLNSGLRLLRSSQQAKLRKDVGTQKITNYELRFLPPVSLFPAF